MTEPPAPLCKQIRRVLSRPEAFAHDQLIDLAQRYGRLVDAVNERLDRAHGWLRQGLRTEALGLVEQPPDAVDAAAQLCLGYGWQQWDELCKSNDVDSMPCPDIEAAAELSDAYDREGLVKEHLVKHRTLALANAAIPERLDVLRVLTECDPENPIWGDQRRHMESDRLTQISHEAWRATSAKDLSALQRLQQELQQCEWLSAPPQRLHDSIAKSMRGMQRARTIAKYETLARQLHEAHGAQDDPLLGRLVGEWGKLHVRTGVAPPEPVATEAEPVLSWWREQQAARQADAEFRRDLARMEELLDDHAAMPELEPLYEKLCRAERELPRSIIARYESRRDEHQQHRRFRMRLIGGSATGVIIVVAAALVWWISEHNRQRQLETWVGQLDTCLKAEDLSKTEQLLDGLQQNHPDLWNEASVVARRKEYDRLDGQDSVRRTELAACIHEIESADELDPSVAGRLKEAQRLARSEEERLWVAQLRERIARARRGRQSELDDVFQRVLAGLNDEYRQTLAVDAPDEDMIPRLEELATRYDAAIQDAEASDELAAAAREQLKALRSDLRERRQKVQRAEEVGAALEEIQANYRDLTSYANLARRFIDVFPEQPEARAFQIVLKDVLAWEYVERWNKLVNSWEGKLAVRDAETAIRFGGSVAELPVELNCVMDGDVPSSFSRYFSRAAVALDPSDSGIACLSRLFEQPWMRELRYVQSNRGRRYYVLGGEIKNKISSDPPTYMVSGVVLSLEALVESALRKEQTIGISGDPKFRETRLCSFAQQAGRDLCKLRPGKWRTIHLELAKRVTTDPGIDPVLRLELARVFLKWHEREGWPSSDSGGRITQFLDRIKQTEFGPWKLSEVPWPDPKSFGVRQAREVAEELLEDVPNLGQLIAESDAAFRELQRYAKAWRPVGLVWRDDNGKRAVLGSIPDGSVGIIRLGEVGQVEFELRGHKGKQGVSFSEGQIPEFGTPLFQPPPWPPDSVKDDDE